MLGQRKCTSDCLYWTSLNGSQGISLCPSNITYHFKALYISNNLLQTGPQKYNCWWSHCIYKFRYWKFWTAAIFATGVQLKLSLRLCILLTKTFNFKCISSELTFKYFFGLLINGHFMKIKVGNHTLFIEGGIKNKKIRVARCSKGKLIE